MCPHFMQVALVDDVLYNECICVDLKLLIYSSLQCLPSNVTKIH